MAYHLWDLYDTYRLWYVPPLVGEYICSMDLSFVLGLVINNRYIWDLIDVVDEIDLSEVPLCQALRGTRHNENHQVALPTQATMYGIVLIVMP